MKTKTDATDAAKGFAEFHHRTGWSVVWSGGFRSAMPNERVARLCAASPGLLESAVGLLDWLDQMFPDEPLFHGCPDTEQSFRIKDLRAAIAKATP